VELLKVKALGSSPSTTKKEKSIKWLECRVWRVEDRNKFGEGVRGHIKWSLIRHVKEFCFISKAVGSYCSVVSRRVE
jgi:hypothetical protein